MSQGIFTISAYHAEYSGVAYHPIKIQPETLGLTIAGQSNVAPISPITSPISASVSSGKRSLGLHASKVSIRFTGVTPAGYSANGILRLPLLDDDIRVLAIAGAIGTYLGVPILVVSNYSREVVR